VRCPNVVRSEHSPLRIEPETGKVAKHVGEPKRKVSSDVLKEGEGGSGLLEDSSDLGPEVPVVVGPEPLSSLREGLAGIPADDDIDAPAPSSPVKGSEVVMDRDSWEMLGEDVAAERLDLTEQRGLAPGLEAEVQPADPGAEAKCAQLHVWGEPPTETIRERPAWRAWRRST